MVWLRPKRSKGQGVPDHWLYGRALSNYTQRMKDVSLGLSLLLSLGFLTLGCGSSSNSNPCEGDQVDCDGVCIDPIAPTLAAIQSDIFEVRGCSTDSCHGGSPPAGSLDLSSVTASGMNLVSINSVQRTELLRVAPSDSSSSYLMNKILGVGMANGTDRMPPNDQGIVLCEEEINAIRQWIDAGANPAPSN